MTLDLIDYQILALLQENARLPQQEIASQVGLSQPAVADRVRKLEERQIIRGYRASLDARALGMDVRAFIGVGVEHPRFHEPFSRRVERLPEVLECHRVAGQDSYLLKVMTESTETLDRLISERIRTIEGVTRTHTTIVLAAVKEELQVPIHAVAESKPKSPSKSKNRKRGST